MLKQRRNSLYVDCEENQVTPRHHCNIGVNKMKPCASHNSQIFTMIKSSFIKLIISTLHGKYDYDGKTG